MKLAIYYILGIIIFIYTFIFKKENVSDFLTFIGTFSIFFIVPTVDNIFKDVSTLKEVKNLFKSKVRYRNTDIRVSISYLFKIKLDDKYLLVKGNRIKQYAPVGGVYKHYQEAKSIFNELGVKDDDCIAIDKSSKNDLRVRVKGKNLIKFIEWFKSGKDREACIYREFYEELVETGIVDKDKFPYINCYFKERVIDDIKYDPYFKCQQILIADIYEIKLDEIQEKELRNLLGKKSEEYIWSDESQISSRGVKKQQDYNVSIPPTAEWII